MYATRKKKRPSQPKPVKILRTVGTHGRYQIVEVLHRGKSALRYVRQS